MIEILNYDFYFMLKYNFLIHMKKNMINSNLYFTRKCDCQIFLRIQCQTVLGTKFS